MSKTFHPKPLAPTQPAQPHLHKKIEDLTLDETFGAIGRVCTDVLNGTVTMRRGENGDQSKDLKRTFGELQAALSARDAAKTHEHLFTIVKAKQAGRVVFHSNDGAAYGRTIHLRDLKLHLQALTERTGRGTVDVTPAVAAGSRR